MDNDLKITLINWVITDNVVRLGKQGESFASNLVIDLSKTRGADNRNAYHLEVNYRDEVNYIPLEYDETSKSAVVPITSNILRKKGTFKAQLIATRTEESKRIVKKSNVFTIISEGSIMAENLPPIEDSAFQAQLRQIENKVAEAISYATHSPIIEDNYWQIWDGEQWQPTDKKATAPILSTVREDGVVKIYATNEDCSELIGEVHDGVDGMNGRDGADGRDGMNGSDGRDGMNGRDGADGRDGIDGKDGKDGHTPELTTYRVNNTLYIKSDGEEIGYVNDGIAPTITSEKQGNFLNFYAVFGDRRVYLGAVRDGQIPQFTTASDCVILQPNEAPYCNIDTVKDETGYNVKLVFHFGIPAGQKGDKGDKGDTYAPDIIDAQEHQPTSETNRVWIATGETEIEIPTMEDISRLSETIYVTPQMFGAKGNGTDDDTNAFKDAIATGKAIIIPDGTYLISDTLELNNSMVGLGLPKIITNTHIESLLYVYNKTQIDIENINFYETSCDNIIKLDWVRNSRFRNLRIANRSGSTLQSTNGVYLVKDCWANIFQNCTFYNLQNGIKADGDVNNLATTNFYGCYFGSNTNAIKANSMSNCHFFGGWIEENENCFRIDVTNNMMLNSFTGVDFEINKIVIYADNVNSNSVLWNFSFSNCVFVCASTGDKINSLIFHDSSSKYLWLNVNMDSCHTDARFRNIATGCLRTYLGLVGMNYRTASHGGSLFNTYAYVYPCYVNASGLDVNIKYDKVDITNDGKTLTVNLPDYAFIHSITVNTQETVTVETWNFSSSTTNMSTPAVTKNGNVNRCNVEGAVKRFIIKSDSDISNATISVNMADYSDFI